MDEILKKININLKYNKLIILGGIYSNYEAFKRFLSIVKQTHQKDSFIVNTGDMFAYFSDPNKVIDLVRKNKIQSIMGNCEESVAFNTEDCGCGFKKESACDLLTNQWYQYSKKKTFQLIIKNGLKNYRIKLFCTINLKNTLFVMVHPRRLMNLYYLQPVKRS